MKAPERVDARSMSIERTADGALLATAATGMITSTSGFGLYVLTQSICLGRRTGKLREREDAQALAGVGGEDRSVWRGDCGRC